MKGSSCANLELPFMTNTYQFVGSAFESTLRTQAPEAGPAAGTETNFRV